MSKVSRILKGWTNLLKSEFGFKDTKGFEAMAKRRLKECIKCEHKTPTTSKIVKVVELGLIVPSESCKLCGCNVFAKAFTPEESCKINKWEKEDGNFYKQNT